MSAVSANRELKLEQELVARRTDRIVGASILTAYLAELARPVRQDHGPAGVAQRSARRIARSIEARPREPAARELVVARHVEAVGAPRRLGPLDFGRVGGRCRRPITADV